MLKVLLWNICLLGAILLDMLNEKKLDMLNRKWKKWGTVSHLKNKF